MPEKPKVQFSWGWIIASLVLGLGLIGLAHLADLVWHWPQVTVGTLTDIGAALLIAFFLFLLERRFTRRITEEVRSAAQAAVEEKTQAFGTRLDDLEARLNARRAETQAAQDQALNSMLDTISFESLTSALAEAERVGAIESNGLIVPASAPEAQLMAHFRYAPEQIYSGSGRVLDGGIEPRFSVTIHAPRQPNDFGLPIYEVHWELETPPEDVGSELETRMKQHGHLVDAKALNFPLALRELQRGLRLALDDQHAPRGEEKLYGKLLEIIGTDWAITSAGLQNLGVGQAWTWDELGIASNRNARSRSKRLAAPDGIDEAEWAFVYGQAEDRRPSGFPFGLL